MLPAGERRKEGDAMTCEVCSKVVRTEMKSEPTHTHEGRPYAHFKDTPYHEHSPAPEGYQSAGAARIREAQEHSIARNESN